MVIEAIVGDAGTHEKLDGLIDQHNLAEPAWQQWFTSNVFAYINDYGADGVIVSNHGGRNLDSSRAPIEVLPEIVAAVQQRIAVVVDSGFRRGSDVVKALAMGANAVMLGRAPLYGTAMGGEAGATRALEIIREEIDSTMALLGCCKVSDLNAEHVTR